MLDLIFLILWDSRSRVLPITLPFLFGNGHSIPFPFLSSGQTPAEAEEKFLDQSQKMELYGVDPHACRVSMISHIAVRNFGRCTLLEFHVLILYSYLAPSLYHLPNRTNSLWATVGTVYLSLFFFHSIVCTSVHFT